MRIFAAILWLLISLVLGAGQAVARTYEVHPATVETEEEFERLANALQPGDELVLHGAAKEFLRENLNVAGQYADYLTAGDVHDEAKIPAASGAITSAPVYFAVAKATSARPVQ